MKELISWGGWPNGIDPPSVDDVLQAARSLAITPEPLARTLHIGVGVRRAIWRFSTKEDPDLGHFIFSLNKLMGIDLVDRRDFEPGLYEFRDAKGNVLHTGIL